MDLQAWGLLFILALLCAVVGAISGWRRAAPKLEEQASEQPEAQMDPAHDALEDFLQKQASKKGRTGRN